MKSTVAAPWKSRLSFCMAVILWLGIGVAALGQSQDREIEPALEGLDPVLLVQGKEVQGNLKITATRGRFQYFFASEEDKAAFEKEPALYEIQLNGACARMGAPVNGSPDLYTVHKGRIYIFGSAECKTRFEAAPEKYLDEPGREKSLKPASTEALKKGHELIEKAVTAMGGPSLVDGLTNYQEKSWALQGRHTGEVQVNTSLTILFPDLVRTDQVMPDFNNPSKKRETAVVLTASDAYAITPDGSRVLGDDYRTLQQRELNRRPLAMLRARKSASFQAAAAGAASLGDVAVEQVMVDFDGAQYTLGIDPASGRILSLSYRRRGPAGDFGQIVKVYSDFRTIGGVTLPFKVTATFNGELWKEQSSTIDSITINGKVDPALFERPKTAKID